MSNILTRIFNKAALPTTEANEARIVPVQLQRIRQDVTTRKAAIKEAEQPYLPRRTKMQQMYVNTRENGFIRACIDRRKDLTLLRKWEFRGANNEVDDKLTDIFCYRVGGKTILKVWFRNYLSYCLDAQLYGYSLIFLNDIVNGDFPKLGLVKRENVNPDRLLITPFPSLYNGIDFINDEDYKDWYIYVSTPNDLGTSQCGYGMFWELSIYEIFLRNLMGFNGDFVELFAQPFRVGKTQKTNIEERNEFENILKNMGSSGYAMLDDIGDSIEFLSSSLGSSGFQSYDNFEQRLEAKCSQIILGHADAIKSIAGKLGASGKDDPVVQAVTDKQSYDAAFILPLVNNQLFDKLRGLGFNIPEGSFACMVNDNEEMETANNFMDLAVKAKQAGLQIDAKYATEKTNIPFVDIAPPTPPQNFTKSITDKLNKLYHNG